MRILLRDAWATVNASIRAGVIYFASAFAIDFLLGAVRVLLVAPRLGEVAAVVLEAPIILTMSWAISGGCARLFRVRAETAPRLLMGAVAFALLMSAELGVSLYFFGRSVAAHIAGYLSVAGVIGFAAQLAFGVLPVLQGRRELS
jgi:hypothetical protein